MDLLKVKTEVIEDSRNEVIPHTSEGLKNENLILYLCPEDVVIKEELIEEENEETAAIGSICKDADSEAFEVKKKIKLTNQHEKDTKKTTVKIEEIYLTRYKNVPSSRANKIDTQILTDGKLYKCHSCNYKNVKKTHVVAHIRVHTGEKPYNCNLCSYKSALRGSLVMHIRTHTGVKPYECKECNYKSTCKANLTRHISTNNTYR